MKLLPLILPIALLVSSAQADVSPKVLKAEAKAFARADQDDDELLTYEEFKLLFKPLTKALKKFPVTGRGDDPLDLLELSGALWGWFDADDNARIDFNEWISARYPAELDGLTAEIVSESFALDRNHDGRVRLTEFLPLVKCFIPASQAKKVYQQIMAAESASSGSSSSSSSSGSSVEIVIIGYDWGSAANGTSSGRGTGGPPTGTPSDTGSGTATGVEASVVESWSSGVSESWTRQDLEDAAAWVSQQSAGESSEPRPTGLPPEMIEYLRRLLAADAQDSDARGRLIELDLWDASQPGR